MTAYRPGALRFAQRLGQGVFGSLLDLDVAGADAFPGSGPVLLAGNHTGYLDGPLVVVHAPREVRALTKVELYRGALGSALDLIGQLPVRRGMPDRTALEASATELAAGGCVAIFPEGTRGTGDLQHVLRGVGWLALHSGAPIVPVACLGSAEALPKGSHRPRWRTRVTLGYGKPFGPVRGPLTAAGISAATQRIRGTMLDHLAVTAARHEARA